MNEWDRLHSQAERYKMSYPPGTRIMLLSMGDDPRPIAENTRGTVDFVDDIGYLVKSYKKRCSTYKKNNCYFIEE